MQSFDSVHGSSIEIISILVTCSFVGWITNYIAVQMIFYPIKFRGFGILGWQGIIPRHSKKMAGLISDVMMERLIRPYDLYKKIDPVQISDLIRDRIGEKSSSIVKDIFFADNPVIWKMVPEEAKQILEKEIREDIPKKIQEIYTSFGKNLESILGIGDLIKESLSGENANILSEIFRRCGGPEFRFIVRSGIYFGFLIGCVQVLFIAYLNQWWTMPLMGIFVGYITNWLAILMIFSPLRPKNFLIFKYQGLFLKRQIDVSREFASVVASKILDPESLIGVIFKGKGGDLIITELLSKSKELMDEKLKKKIPYASLILGSKKLEELKEKIANSILELVPETADKMKDYIEERLEIEKLVFENLSILPPEEFEHLLHSVFKEDEAILISLGAFLGGIAGSIQAYLVFIK
ncbi:DUF445 domain-containing protein [Leptospira saintgironsiae]|uniref:DUF445 domain-containing protein n=1 Tax=Leptospira saintgironsiae TaxID=2023183 RepID=A0A2M9YG61_9LEPT|nr:DUF445 domain-containing protein [Leptospira saintgironsiae]PJZ50520.1 DUF445 domain-containing protein [Leptospira saintgironsiae]